MSLLYLRNNSLNTLTNFNINHQSGVDEISNKVVKVCKHELAEPLLACVQAIYGHRLHTLIIGPCFNLLYRRSHCSSWQLMSVESQSFGLSSRRVPRPQDFQPRKFVCGKKGQRRPQRLTSFQYRSKAVHK